MSDEKKSDEKAEGARKKEPLPNIKPHPLTELNKQSQQSVAESTNSRNSQSLTPSPGKLNIAMAVDPTYRGGMSSSASTSSSGGGQEFDGNAPPYMPIQGQKRMMSLEKKQKKKNKEGGCKQQ